MSFASFLRAALPALLLAMAVFSDAKATTVAIVDAIAAPQSQYAARKLGAALADHGYTLQESRARADLTITLTLNRKALGAESFSIARKDRGITIAGGDHRGLIYGALALREQLLNGTPLEKTQPARAEARARLPRHQVQHALGHLPSELGARPALRHGARLEVLGGLPRHDGREPLQRVHVVDHASVHLHDPAEELPGSQQVDRCGVRRMAAPVSRNLPHGQGARPRHLRGVLEHLRQRGVREGAQRRERKLLPALLRPRRHLGNHQALSARKRHADAGGVSGPRWHRRVAWRRHGGHDAARAPAIRRRGVHRRARWTQNASSR